MLGLFVWLGLYELDNVMFDFVQEEFGLYDFVIEDVCNVYQWFKLEVYGDVFFIVLNIVQMENGNVVFGEMYFFVGRDFFVLVWYGLLVLYLLVCECCECML